MDDWPQESLGVHADIRARIGWRGLSSDEYTKDGPYLVAGQHIIDGEINWQACDHVSSWRYDESPEIALRERDVLISKDGTIGRVARVDSLPGPATLNGTMMLVRPRRELDHRFLAHSLGGHEFQALIRDRISGSSVPHLFQRDLFSLRLRLPPLEEQRRIAEVLDAADETIRSAKRVLAKYESARAGLCEDLLAGSAVGRPNRWAVEKLGRLGSFVRSRGGPKSDEVKEGLPCVRYGDLYTFHDCRITDTRSRIDADRRQLYTRLLYGDLLFAGSGETLDEIGKSAVNLIREPAYCGGDVIVFRPEIQINPSYLGHVADSSSSRIQKSRMGRGSTVMHIYSDQLKDLRILVPPLEEQRRIADVLDAADAAIRAEGDRLGKLRALRAGLSRDLLSGRVRAVTA